MVNASHTLFPPSASTSVLNGTGVEDNAEITLGTL